MQPSNVVTPTPPWCQRTADAWFLPPVDLADLVELRLDLVRHPVEAVPFLAELWRFVRRLQLLAAAPLDVIDDAPPIQTAMEADGNKPRLALHEARALLHQGEGLRLLPGLGLDDGDLGDGLIVGSDLRHGRPRLLATDRAI